MRQRFLNTAGQSTKNNTKNKRNVGQKELIMHFDYMRDIL